MTFPLTLWDISLLLAVTAITLLVTSELLSPYYGKINAKINKKRLRNTAMTFSILFLATVALRIANILLNA
ncbi:hypothetical protein MUP79_07765 [Candidatus Bathyarchaeota archaeon]|jgi:hypothetical protein|nr:hypothetical protein [Candidatus Bathyarchaeota archaeon]